MPKPGTLCCPAGVYPKLQSAAAKYRIRPANEDDLPAILNIFRDGFSDYSPTGKNKREVFPAMDAAHEELLMKCEYEWSLQFGNYVARESKTPNLSDMMNYWSLPRRSVFLVAEERDTNEVVGCVALHDLNLVRGGDRPVDVFTMSNTLCNTTTVNPNNTKYSWTEFAHMLRFTTGSLPADFYLLDDPFYDPATASTTHTPYNVVLPTAAVPPQIISTTALPNPPERYKDTCRCQQHGLSYCASVKNTQQRFNPLSLKEKMLAFNALSAQDIEEIFCPCVLSALDQSVELLDADAPQKKEKTICSFCIQDAKYLAQPLLLTTATTPEQQTPEYIVNPVFLGYTNPITEGLQYNAVKTKENDDEQEEQQPNIIYNTPNQFKDYIKIPHGYARRFKAAWDVTPPAKSDEKNTDMQHVEALKKDGDKEFFATDKLYENILYQRDEHGVITIANVPMTAYDDYVAYRKEYNKNKQKNNVEEKEEEQSEEQKKAPWLNRYHIPTSAYPADPLTTHTHHFTGCELKRMSVSGRHRGEGLAQLLLFQVLFFGRFVFGYDYLHLSTAGAMNTAKAFYSRMGLHSELDEMIWFGVSFPISHFTTPLTQRGARLNHRLFEVNRMWPSDRPGSVPTKLIYDHENRIARLPKPEQEQQQEGTK